MAQTYVVIGRDFFSTTSPTIPILVDVCKCQSWFSLCLALYSLFLMCTFSQLRTTHTRHTGLVSIVSIVTFLSIVTMLMIFLMYKHNSLDSRDRSHNKTRLRCWSSPVFNQRLKMTNPSNLAFFSSKATLVFPSSPTVQFEKMGWWWWCKSMQRGQTWLYSAFV